MSQTASFQCPSCGAYLEFDPQGQRFLCPYCAASFDEAELVAKSDEKEMAAEEARAQSQHSRLRGYHCQSCGAEIVTGDTTAATRCYYCHQPVVLADRLDGDFRPDGVIPFRLDKNAARKKFDEYVKHKKFIDHAFFAPQQLEDFSGVYYPYWFADVETDASFTGVGTKVNIVRGGNKTVTTTRYYAVKRQARLTMRNMVRKALNSADRKLSDGIHPYAMEEQKPFAMGYLSGFLAEMRDVEAEAVRPDVIAEAERYAQDMMKEGHSYQSLQGETSLSHTQTKLRYMLLPAWILTYKGEKGAKPYYYMMNGQTGAVCGRLPVKKGKLALWSAVLGVAVYALLCVGGMFVW